jgi:hypothetical protein
MTNHLLQVTAPSASASRLPCRRWRHVLCQDDICACQLIGGTIFREAYIVSQCAIYVREQNSCSAFEAVLHRQPRSSRADVPAANVMMANSHTSLRKWKYSYYGLVVTEVCEACTLN